MPRTWVKLYKEGDTMGVETNAQDEKSFTDAFGETLAEALAHHEGDESFQLQIWIPQGFEIIAKLRGYSTDVAVSQVLVSGTVYPEGEQTVYYFHPSEGKKLKSVK